MGGVGRVRASDRRSVFVVLILLLASPAVWADDGLDSARRLVQAGVTIEQADIETGRRPLREIRRQGMLVFSTPFGRADGYGDGPVDARDPVSPGGRPTLQGNGTFLRVNGLDAQTCLECHSVLSAASVPMRFGIGGVGGASSNAMFQATTIDPDDERGAGFATFDGRFINPPFLFGTGGVQLLAAEMTEDLAALRERAFERPGEPIRLVSKGVDFGEVVAREGRLDVSRIEGVDGDLVVRPFGRKGEFETVRDFDLDALRFHFGMEPVELVGRDVDGDGDGVANEIGPGAISALEIFEVTLPRPVRDRPSPAARRGRRRFAQAGCADCHRPALRTRSNELALSRRGPDGEPLPAHARIRLDAPRPGFEATRRGGVSVPLFADLKRHWMGDALAESFGSPLDGFFTTARLWGVADTAPYLHDGRALTLSEAILLHGGEAQSARDAFAALDDRERAELLAFLETLRTPTNPTADLESRGSPKRH